MITIRTGSYTKKHMELLLKALNDAQDTIECLGGCKGLACKTCPNRIPCFDIFEARQFLANKIREDRE